MLTRMQLNDYKTETDRQKERKKERERERERTLLSHGYIVTTQTRKVVMRQ